MIFRVLILITFTLLSSSVNSIKESDDVEGSKLRGKTQDEYEDKTDYTGGSTKCGDIQIDGICDCGISALKGVLDSYCCVAPSNSSSQQQCEATEYCSNCSCFHGSSSMQFN